MIQEEHISTSLEKTFVRLSDINEVIKTLASQMKFVIEL